MILVVLLLCRNLKGRHCLQASVTLTLAHGKTGIRDGEGLDQGSGRIIRGFRFERHGRIGDLCPAGCPGSPSLGDKGRSLSNDRRRLRDHHFRPSSGGPNDIERLCDQRGLCDREIPDENGKAQNAAHRCESADEYVFGKGAGAVPPAEGNSSRAALRWRGRPGGHAQGFSVHEIVFI